MKISRVMASLLLAVGFAVSTVTTASADEAMPKNCVVNGDEFAEHKNPPIEVTHNDESIKVCCKKCARKFKKDPEKYIKKYKEAVQGGTAKAAEVKSASVAANSATPAAEGKTGGSCCSGH